MTQPIIEQEDNRSSYMRGFPVPKDKRVTGDENWLLDPDQGSWAMQHVEQFLDIGFVARGSNQPVPLSYADSDLFDRNYMIMGKNRSFREVCATLDIDAILMMKRGKVVVEYYRNGMHPGKRHSMNSVTKTYAATLAGCLIEEGILDPHQPLGDRFMQLADSGVADATLQHALDMSIGVEWPMSHQNLTSHWFQNFRAGGFLKRPAGFEYDTTMDLIATSQKTHAHGSKYHYASVCTEMIGWSITEVMQTPWQQVLSDRIWSQLGAENDGFVVVDKGGHGLATCGLSGTVRDMARFGNILAHGGQVGGRQIVPGQWIAETARPNDTIKNAWNAGQDSFGELVEFYHNQCRVTKSNEEYFAAGGLGQLILVNLATETTCAVLSTSYGVEKNHAIISFYQMLRDAVPT